MNTIFIIIGTICVGIIIGILANNYSKKDKIGKALIIFFLGVIGLSFYGAGLNLKGENEAYINILNGYNPYEKVYRYEKVLIKDSTSYMFPYKEIYKIVDSVYIKKEDHE